MGAKPCQEVHFCLFIKQSKAKRQLSHNKTKNHRRAHHCRVVMHKAHSSMVLNEQAGPVIPFGAIPAHQKLQREITPAAPPLGTARQSVGKPLAQAGHKNAAGTRPKPPPRTPAAPSATRSRTASSGKHWRRSAPLPTGTRAQKSPGHGLGAFARQGAGAGYNSNSMMAGVTW